MRRGVPFVALVALAAGLIASAVTAGAASGANKPVVYDDSQSKPQSITLGGAKVLNTTHTVDHWFGTALNPDNGVTYGFNMVGKTPAAGNSDTIPVDIIPLNLTLADGSQWNGSDFVTPILQSPQFQNFDYTTVPAATDGTGQSGPGGALSSGNTSEQLEDATMRSQFNLTGDSGYHMLLGTPVVHPAISLSVPAGSAVQAHSLRGIPEARVSLNWFAARIQNLNQTLGYIDPTHLPIYVTDEVLLYVGSNPGNCCIFGFHGASEVRGNGTGATHGNGNQIVQTYAWSTWVTPGTFKPFATASSPAPCANFSCSWAIQDMDGLSHEISEWADDPFVNNHVENWSVTTEPQYGCQSILETGDPVVAIGFGIGSNPYDQNAYSDGMWHPEDEVFLPWFMRTSPNTTSQDGRYTFMAGLNQNTAFHSPATSC
jgi:hypothetical protein